MGRGRSHVTRKSGVRKAHKRVLKTTRQGTVSEDVKVIALFVRALVTNGKEGD